MKEKKVKDIMIPIENYATTKPDETLKEGVLILKRSQCVFDQRICTEAGPRTIFVTEGQKLVGILDFKQILKVLIPDVSGNISGIVWPLGGSKGLEESDGIHLDEPSVSVIEKIRQNAEVKVKNIMLKVKGSIDADSDLLDALKLLFKNKITKLPVYEKNKLVGVVRDTDLFLSVAKILEKL